MSQRRLRPAMLWSRRMRVVRLTVLGGALLVSLASIGPGGEPLPKVDTCSQPGDDGVSAVAFLPSSGTGQVADLDTHELIYGPQGGAMLPLRFGLQGQGVPSCARFTLSLERCLELGCSQNADATTHVDSPALKTYQADPGHNTKEFLMILPYQYEAGMLVRIRAAVGNSPETSLLLWIAEEGSFADAGSAAAVNPAARCHALEQCTSSFGGLDISYLGGMAPWPVELRHQLCSTSASAVCFSTGQP